MKGPIIAFLTQGLLLLGTSAGLNQPANAHSAEYLERVSTETIQKSLNLKSGGLILLDVEFGNVTIREYEGKEIRVELTLQGSPEGISGYRFTHNYFGDQLTLKGWSEKGTGARNPQLKRAEFVIMVPAGLHYAIKAQTRQGSVRAAVSRDMKGIDLSTEAGKVRIELPADLQVSIDASTSGVGGVSVAPASVFSKLCPKCEIRRDDRLKVKMNGGGPEITAYSAIGSVHLEIVESAKERQS